MKSEGEVRARLEKIEKWLAENIEHWEWVRDSYRESSVQKYGNVIDAVMKHLYEIREMLGGGGGEGERRG